MAWFDENLRRNKINQILHCLRGRHISGLHNVWDAQETSDQGPSEAHVCLNHRRQSSCLPSLFQLRRDSSPKAWGITRGPFTHDCQSSASLETGRARGSARFLGLPALLLAAKRTRGCFVGNKGASFWWCLSWDATNQELQACPHWVAAFIRNPSVLRIEKPLRGDEHRKKSITYDLN